MNYKELEEFFNEVRKRDEYLINQLFKNIIKNEL